MFFYSFNPWMLFLLIVPMLLALAAQAKVSSTFKKYNAVKSKQNVTGKDIAEKLLALSNINDVRVEHIAGNLTDHYDPNAKVIRLSDAVFGSDSLAALAVAAHETGHAVQHATGYSAIVIRGKLFPTVAFSSRIAPMIVGLGLLFSIWGGTFGIIMLYIGIVLFSVVVLFQIVTLPVEFNASKRAMDMLEDHNILAPDEIGPAKSVLSAAAMTYVASAIVTIANLLRLIIIAKSRRNRG